MWTKGSWILFLCFVLIGSVGAQEFVIDGLIAYWSFDDGTINGDTVTDLSDKGNDATMMGKLEAVDSVKPGLGQALLLFADP